MKLPVNDEVRARFRVVVAVHLFLLRNHNTELLLVRRYNTGYEDGSYSVVAGHLEGGERVVTAAIREAREEIGVRIDEASVKVVGVMHRRSEEERIDFFVTTSDWQGEIHNAEPHKCDELRWSPLDTLPENVIPYVRQAIENVRTGQWFDSFGWE